MLPKHLEQIFKGQGKKKGLAKCFSRSVCENLLSERKILETSSITAPLKQMILQQMACIQKNRLAMLHTFTINLSQ